MNHPRNRKPRIGTKKRYQGDRKSVPTHNPSLSFAWPWNSLHARRVLFFMLLLPLVSPLPANSQSQEPVEPPSEQRAQYSVKLPTKEQGPSRVSFVVKLAPESARPGKEVTLTVEATIAPDWHIAAIGSPVDDTTNLPTTIVFKGSHLTPIDKTFVPSVKPKIVTIDGVEQLQHARTVTWQRKYRVAEGAARLSGTGSIGFQVCNEVICLPPSKLEFSLGVVVPETVSSPRSNKSRFKTVGKPIGLVLTESKLRREIIDYTTLITADPNEDMDKYIEQMTSAMGKTEPLPLCAKFTRDGDTVAIYIPDREQYPLTNTGDNDTRYSNTSTFVSIDHNGDGKFEDYESVPTNLPIRLFDSMFLVKLIDKARPEITIQELNLPLAGAVLGRKCPEFWYETVEGRVVSNETILGAVTILDIWAST